MRFFFKITQTTGHYIEYMIKFVAAQEKHIFNILNLLFFVCRMFFFHKTNQQMLSVLPTDMFPPSYC